MVEQRGGRRGWRWVKVEGGETRPGPDRPRPSSVPSCEAAPWGVGRPWNAVHASLGLVWAGDSEGIGARSCEWGCLGEDGRPFLLVQRKKRTATA